MSKYIAEHLGFHDVANRNKLKAAVFQVLFTDNRFIGQYEAEPKRVFKKLFPDVYKLFSMIKRSNKVNLPMLLQRIESRLVLQVITKRISEEYPSLPIFTIHDSIVTLSGRHGCVVDMMNKNLIEVFDIAPRLSVKHWIL